MFGKADKLEQRIEDLAEEFEEKLKEVRSTFEQRQEKTEETLEEIKESVKNLEKISQQQQHMIETIFVKLAEVDFNRSVSTKTDNPSFI